MVNKEFEFWATEQGIDCTSVDGIYIASNVHVAYSAWTTSRSSKQKRKFDLAAKAELDAKYANVSDETIFRIIKDNLSVLTDNPLLVLQPEEVTDSHCIRVLNMISRLTIERVTELNKLTSLTCLLYGLKADTFKLKKDIKKAEDLIKAVRSGTSWGWKLEADITQKINSTLFDEINKVLKLNDNMINIIINEHKKVTG
jgi:hypothetical protein